MVYQDPVGDKFQERWHNLKSWVIVYPSMYDVSGFTWEDLTQVVQIKYDTLWENKIGLMCLMIALITFLSLRIIPISDFSMEY